jgi:hypothetical protein
MKAYLLSDARLYDQVVADHDGLFPGVYRLHYRGAAGEFDVIPRLLGSDPQGVLYIGTSISVPYRLGSLKKSVCAAYRRDGYIDPSAHQCGKKIIQSSKFIERFLFDGLCVSVQRLDRDDEDIGQREDGHTKLEWRLLSDYFAEFGEFPPLNG